MTEMTISISNDSMIPSLKKILGSLSWVSNIKVKRSRKATSKKTTISPSTETFFKEVFGKSTDPRSAEEIIADVENSRTTNHNPTLEKAFK